MHMLVDGEWRTDAGEATDESGRFVRGESTFRNWVSDDATAEFPVESGRYHLYVSYACPWAHRTLIARSLLGLEDAIPVSVVDPIREDGGWQFTPEKEGCTPDPNLGAEYLRELYVAADPSATCRVTVPVLWDTERDSIVNNESREILRMVSTAFRSLASYPVELASKNRRDDIDEIIDAIYEPINNGVYRAGFAASQAAYDAAVEELFGALDRWDDHLAEHRYLDPAGFSEADICMFTTLVRFDHVYHTHFKCNVKRILDYPNLWPYLRDIYQTPGVSDTVNLTHIRAHYYRTHPDINPTRIVARGPDLPLTAAHGRDTLPGHPPASTREGSRSSPSTVDD